MFNIGPLELGVLALVALIVLGPEKLPGFARDAARMLRTLRELATGARQQLQDELGPEFADLDLRNLNPRTAITRAVFGDEPPDLDKYNPRNFDARGSMQRLWNDEPAVSMTKKVADAEPASGTWTRVDSAGPVRRAADAPHASASRPRPRPRPTAGSAPGRGYGDVT